MEEGGKLGEQKGPCLLFRHGPESGQLTLWSASSREAPRALDIPELQYKRVWNCYYANWLILSLKHPNYSQISLWNFVTRQHILLPNLDIDDYGIKDCILLLPPSSINSTIFVFERPTKSIYFSRLHGEDNKKWITHCYKDTIESMKNKKEKGGNWLDKRKYHFYAPFVTSKGELYALNHRRHILVRIKLIYNQSLVEIQPLVRMPCPLEQVGEREIIQKLFESCGEIFAIIAAFVNKDINMIERSGNDSIDVETYKLNVEMNMWERDELRAKDNQTFFVSGKRGGVVFSCSADLYSEIRGNCIYFARKKDSHLYLYDIEDDTISVTQPCPNLPRPDSVWPIWIMPHSSSISSHDCQALIMNDGGGEAGRYGKAGNIEMKYSSQRNFLDNFPLHLLIYISQKLNYWGYKNFGLASNMCRQVAPPLEINHRSLVTPWLVYLNKKNNEATFNMLGPKRTSDRHIIRVPESLQDATICHCKYGWLLMCKFIDTSNQQLRLYFVNPFTKNVIQYPDLFSANNLSYMRFGFSSPPTSPNCIVIVLIKNMDESGGVYICFSREKGWIYQILGYSVTAREKGFCNSVFVNGAFFSMSRFKEVGSFRFEERSCNWIPLENTQRSYLYSFQGFLAESCNGEELLSFFIDDDTGRFLAFKFDPVALLSNKITSLGKRTMYVSRISCILTEAENPDMEDKIVFSRFHVKEYMVSLSLKTGKFYSSERQTPLNNFQGTTEQLRCCWIQPCLS